MPSDLFTHYLNARDSRPLSKSRLAVLSALSEFLQEHGYSPTVREIAENLQFRSHASVHAHLDALSMAGLLTRRPRSARSWLVTERGQQELASAC